MNKLNTRGGYIEAIHIQNVSLETYTVINDIRKDCWSYFIDYISCDGCDKSFTKGDVFGSIDPSYRKKTITELEQEHTNIVLPCDGSINYIRKDKSYDDLKERIEQSISSSLVVYRDQVNNTIQGFSLGYVDYFENIYEREFAPYFKDELRDVLKDYMGKIYSTIAATCVNEPYSHLSIIFDLVKCAFLAIDEKYKDHPSTTEYITGSVTEKIYTLMGGKQMHLFDNYPGVYKGEPISDILFHDTAYNDYVSAINQSLSQILKMRKLKKT